ncbi:MAG: Uma2 family endonuclease [Burkholderiaceae bacterium]|nr:Uma2 family endonuclease [Burkholderiaceae bacterium]MDH3459522.1 Uma2 family endonuclease [Burkholderiaceae bacterium]
MGLPIQKLSLAEYLAWENEQPDRNEYWRGEIFAMVGARRGHGRVVANLVRHIGNHLANSPCQVFSEAMKVQIGNDAVLYPDVFVTCDHADLATDMIFRSPSLVVEVLSPTTQAYDRSQKFSLYRRIEALREYVLIDSDSRRVEVFRLGADGLWDLHDMSDGTALVLGSIECRIAFSDLFDGIDSAAQPQ